MRSEMLKELHISHQGMQRTKAHTRKFIYWPSMTKHIEHMVETCPTCQQFQPRNQKEPLISHDIPELPWFKVAADIFEIRGQSFLLIVDYMSKFPEVMNIKGKTATTVIEKMKAVYARHGIPKELVCDHVPFASYEMKKFAAEWGIKLTHSSPAYSQSNGLAERTINHQMCPEKSGTVRHGPPPCFAFDKKYSYHWYVLLTCTGSDGKSSEEHLTSIQ